MGWLTRMGLFLAGLCICLLAQRQLETGHFEFANASYHQSTFAASGFGLGSFVLLLAFLPPGDWVYRHITTKRRRVMKRKPSKNI